VKSEDLSDSSFYIALAELRKARDTHVARGHNLKIRCVFLEKDKRRFTKLEKFVKNIEDVEVKALNKEFEHAVLDVVQFIKQDRDTFPFVFIDPTGWTGFSMKTIAPLLQLNPCEVLINFMMEFITRFIKQQGLREGFERLFGTSEFDAGLRDLAGRDLDDAVAEKYCDRLRKVSNFSHVLRAIVLHPDKNRSHFQLIYATRHPKGAEVFKKTEEKAMAAQENSRAHVEDRKKKAGGQSQFFPPEEMPESKFYLEYRGRYLRQAREAVISEINQKKRVAYHHVWDIVVAFPMVWERDLREWLKEWQDQEKLEIEGMGTRERVPKRDNSKHVIVALKML